MKTKVLFIISTLLCIFAFSQINAQDSSPKFINPVILESSNTNVLTYYNLGNRSLDKALFQRARMYYENALSIETSKDAKSFLKYKINKTDELMRAVKNGDLDLTHTLKDNLYYLYVECLGDAYLLNADYGRAKDVFYTLLNAQPESNLYNTRFASAELGLSPKVNPNVVVEKFSVNPEPKSKKANLVSERAEAFVDGKLIYSTTKFSKDKYIDPATGGLFYHLFTADLDEFGAPIYDKNAFLNKKKIYGNEINDFAFSFDKVDEIAYFERIDRTDPFNSAIYTTALSGGVWQQPEYFAVNGVGQEMAIGQPAISPDGNHLLFITKRDNNKEDGNIWIAHKKSNNYVEDVPKEGNHRIVSKDDIRLSLTPRVSMNVDDNLVANNMWTVPEMLEINTAGDELYPTWINNECFAFSSDGYVGYGGSDLYLCIKDRNTGKFNIVKHVDAPINDNLDAYHIVLRDDSDKLYFTKRSYPNEKTHDEIYFFNKVSSNFDLKITVLDYITMQPVPNASASIQYRGEEDIVEVDENGVITYHADNIEENYLIDIVAEYYYKEHIDIHNNPAVKIIPVDNSYEYTVYLVNNYLALKEDCDEIEKERDRLKMNVSGLSADLLTKEEELSEKEQALADKEAEAARLQREQDSLNAVRQAELDALLATLKQKEADIADKSKRIDDLERSLQAQRDKMQTMKDKVRAALLSFDGNGLTITEKDGKLYVSLDASLLFASGKWDILPAGKTALDQVAKVLATQEDISIVVEGHTDSDKMNGAVVKDNLDLSVMRASAVSKILLNEKGLDPSRILTAGRGDAFPLVSNDSPANKAKNRRVEIIIEPNLDSLLELLND